jgi:hypothetical protein
MHRQLASSPITKLRQDFAAEGAFGAIMRYVREGQVSSTVAEGWAAFVFKDLGDRVSEAKEEIRRIEQVLDRLAQVCAQGAKTPMFDELALRALGLSRDLNTLDGWLISLYETELTMLLFVNPPRAKEKPAQMARSMQALIQKRIAEGNFLLKAPELFRPGQAPSPRRASTI